MAEMQVLGWGTQSAPATRTTKQSEDFTVLAINATFDGTAAGSSFLPCVEIVSDAGQIVARCPVDTAVSAGGSAEVTFAPFLRTSQTGAATGGIQFDTFPQTGNWLHVDTTGTDPNSGDGIILTGASDIEINSGNDVDLIATRDVVVDATRDLNTVLGRNLLMDALSGFVRVRTKGDMTLISGSGGVGGFLLTGDSETVTIGGDVAYFVTGQFLVDSSDITLDGPVTMTANNHEIKLGVGDTLTVFDHSNNPIFRVDEDGDLHGLTGKSLVFDL